MGFVHGPGPLHPGNGQGGAAAEAQLEAERRRLALLWNAFEEAETRVTELEVLLERQRLAAETAQAPAPPAPPAPPQVIVRTVERPVEVEVEAPLRPEPRYPVDVFRVAHLPGMTAAEAEALRTYGVNLSDAFLHIDLDKLTEATGIARDRLQRFRDICEVLALHGVGPVWAERLVDAGITTIKAIAAMEPAQLQRMLLRSYEARGGKARGRVLLQRTLPARCQRLVAVARAAERQL